MSSRVRMGRPLLTVVQNASSATMEGLEMDFTWVITEGLSLRGNVGLLDASYDDFLTSSANRNGRLERCLFPTCTGYDRRLGNGI